MTKSVKLGQVFITRAGRELLAWPDVAGALARHVRRDWGEVSEHDAIANDEAGADGGRLFSVYRDRHGTKFWIITEPGQGITTVMLPEDY